MREACRLAASPQLRNMGTIGGNLLQATRCWYWRLKFPCRLHGGDTCHARDGQHREHAFFGNDFCASAHPSDPAAALLAIGARIRTDRRELGLAELYRLPTDDDRSTTTLAPDELILELELPEVEASSYLKAMDRRRWAFALVGVAAARVGGETRIALAGAAPIPWLLSSPDRARRCHAARRHGLQGRDRPHAGGASDRSALDTIRGRHATRAPPFAARPRFRALALGVRRRRRRGVGLQRTARGCETVDAPAAKEDGGETAPTGSLEAGTTYELVVQTNCGDFTITLDPKLAPKTTASLVALAEDGFYKDTTFHRVVPGFVIQGGDPTGTGTGGPGYTTTDAPPTDTQYTEGTVAMAKSPADPPGTSGSQFFVVTAPDAGLPPEYAVIGTVTRGHGDA